MKPTLTGNSTGRGTVSGLSLSSILQILAVEKNDSAIQVFSAGKKGVIYLFGGEVIDAVTPEASGMAAMHAICSWSDPIVRVRPASAPRTRTIHLPLIHILLETCRQADERPEQDVARQAAEVPQEHAANNGRSEPDRIIPLLMGIPEVLHCTVLDRCGKILAQSSKKIRFQAPFTFAILAGCAIRDILHEGTPEFATLHTKAGEVLLLAACGERALGMYLKKSAEPRTILSRVKALLAAGNPSVVNG